MSHKFFCLVLSFVTQRLSIGPGFDCGLLYSSADTLSLRFKCSGHYGFLIRSLVPAFSEGPRQNNNRPAVKARPDWKALRCKGETCFNIILRNRRLLCYNREDDAEK